MISVKRVWMWVAAGVCVLAGIVGLSWLIVSKLMPEPVGPLAVPAPLVSASFADGYRLDIVQVGEGSVTDGIMSPPGGSGGLLGHSSGSSMSSFGMTALNVEVFTLNEQVAGLQFRSECLGDLVLEVRLLDGTGRAVEVRRHVQEGTIKDGNVNVGGSGSAEWTEGSSAAMTDPAASPADWPDVVVQLSDGTGGWITGTGPIQAKEDSECRGAMVFRGWPRSGPELVFRALRPGCPPVEFRLPQPARRAVAAWSPSPLPQTHKEADFTLTLRSVAEEAVPERGHFLAARVDFEPRYPDNRRFGTFGTKLACELLDVEGALGSRGVPTWISIGTDASWQGTPVPPDETLLRFNYRVSRTNGFPQPLSRAEIVAEAELDADGTTMRTIWRSSAHGIARVEVGDVTTDNDRQAFGIEVAASWPTPAAAAAAKGALGDWQALNPVVFLDGGTESAGYGYNGGHGRSQSGGRSEVTMHGEWTGTLAPGQKLKIGLAPLMPPTNVSFVIDRPSATWQRNP